MARADSTVSGMARAIWEAAYTEWYGAGTGVGVKIPPTPKAANDAAADLVALFVELNKVDVEELRHRSTLAMESTWPAEHGRPAGPGGGEFGYYLARRAMGHEMVGFPKFKVQVPQFEASFDGQELAWSGEATKTARVARQWRHQQANPCAFKVGDRVEAGEPGDAHYDIGTVTRVNPIYVKWEVADKTYMEEPDAIHLVGGGCATPKIPKVGKTAKHNPDENPDHWPSSKVQSLLFAKDQWTAAGAKKWAAEHGYVTSGLDEHGTYHRLRQQAPGGGPCRTIEFGAGIKAVVCASGRGRPPGVPNPRRKKNPDTFADDIDHWDD